jgi:hypothetical protein
MPLEMYKDIQPYGVMRRVLTKKFLMSIIHRITIQIYRVQSGFCPFLSDTAVSAGERCFLWQPRVDEILEQCVLTGRY